MNGNQQRLIRSAAIDIVQGGMDAMTPQARRDARLRQMLANIESAILHLERFGDRYASTLNHLYVKHGEIETKLWIESDPPEDARNYQPETRWM